ncbi:DUF2512 family protein [Alkalihalobacterium elongatum]|uniref:DUF2512 family protein n=1 Tax=Alkalihalobacterium elongatum TaxID=2675466 RepID=UPI001C1FB411|nr:DUF2512 family protein [Alkalihalobacterium elongatum]
MKHVRPLLIKFVVTSLLLFFVLTLGVSVPIGYVIIISIAYTLFSYYAIDLLALPRINNILTCVIDTTVAFIIIFLVTWTISPVPLLGASIISAIGIGAGEWFFHKYLGMYIFIGELEDTAVIPTHTNLQTEIAEEEDIHSLKDKDYE